MIYSTVSDPLSKEIKLRVKMVRKMKSWRKPAAFSFSAGRDAV